MSFPVVYDVVQYTGMIFLGLLVLIGFNTLYAIVAAILVAIEVSSEELSGKETMRQ